ncbi:FxSxx-COOH system tetratricopeptide repeat protein [Nocardiopsis lambiniae]|uniref:FxSxx-COOH system tetratricopeptide repeat protein n=1 Tax=Nocardiopsis lambiniae TaxID=3075539 RepID=A0ABU2M990_9ACTN|nr:FxSxx-COOH system tetratricopeptide repeat protein [Nocardiopsis sp. DSM 44743]MDT0329237.1 FxSxx-COOH system tetratricopeptide repeat protein [Nocardiopsis sp. DSM 44743]
MGGRAPGRSPEVWGGVPGRNKNFTGRAQQLNALRFGLMNQITAVVPHTLHGYGGVGKTLMAVEYAYRYRHEYDLVWWINADQPGLVRSSLAHLAPHMGLPGVSSTGIEEAAETVLNALRRGDPYRRWLLIYDNADEPEDLRDVIPEGHETGHVLITSRNHRWQSVAETVSVDVFPDVESVEFLKKRIPRGITRAEAEELAEALGHLPLALEQAGALRSETGMSNREYLRLLAEQPASLLREGAPSEYPTPMTAAWQLSVSKLRENLPEAMDLLRCCAFFGPEPIPRDVFFPVEEGPVRPEMIDLLANPIKLIRVIGQLARYALIRLDNSNRTIQVHRLIQTLIRAELSSEEQRGVREEVWSLLAAAAPSAMNNPASQDRYLELLPHLRPSGIAESTLPEAREFALKVLTFLYTSGNYAMAERYAHEFVEQWASVSGPDDPHVLEARLKYANRLRELGRYQETYDLDRTLLEQTQRVLGPEHRLTLAVRSGIGADLRAKGEFQQARESDEETLRLHREALGPADPATLRAMYNLAVDLALTSDFSGARDLHERVYMLHKRHSATQSAVHLLIYLHGLALAVRLAGDYIEACDLGEDALAYGREQLGADHPRTLRTQIDLATSLRMNGDLEQALELAQDAHSRHLRLYGLDHPETLAAAMCLANTWRMHGALAEALQLAEDTDLRYDQIYGAEHPYNHGCTSNVALLYRMLGDPSKARRLNEASLAGVEEKLGRDHHYALGITLNLASDLSALNDTKNAVRLGRGSLRRMRALLGEEHPMVLSCSANLILDLRAEGEDDEADRLLAQVEPLYARVHGREHQFTEAFLSGRRMNFDFDPRQL